jgi:hypothetical protein
MPRSEWILTPGAFEPVVDHVTYCEAQCILQGRTINRKDDELLNGLRGLLAKEGRLSLRLIKTCDDVPSPSTYRQRFGSLRRAYELIGYIGPGRFRPIDLRRRTQALREGLIGRIVAMFPDDVAIVRRGGRWRSQLRLKDGLAVSVLIVRSVRVWKDAIRWRVSPVLNECKYITLLARLDNDNCAFLDFHVVPGVDRVRRFDLRLEDAWLNRGQRLSALVEFCEVVARLKSTLTTAAPAFICR